MKPPSSPETVSPAAEAESAEESGRARVRRVLIGPLEQGGMRRKRGVSVDEHRGFLGWVARHLAYMTEDELRALRSGLERMGVGPSGDVWPSPQTIVTIGNAIRSPRLDDCELTTSWMKSRAGAAAWEESPLIAVALLDFFAKRRRGRRPPAEFEMRAIREAGEVAAKRLEAAKARIVDGEARVGDRQLVEGCEREIAEARRFVFPEG